MKKQKLIIIKNSPFKAGDSFESENVITFNEIKKWFRTLEFAKHIFSYAEVELKTYRYNLLYKPFLTALALKLLSKGKCYITDDQGNRIEISNKEVINLYKSFQKDKKNTPNLLNSTNEEISVLEKEIKSKKYLQQVNYDHQSIYLRTDLWFGVQSGGSVGHIAGVLNNLDNYTSNPIFISTDEIPTVRENIEKKIIQPDLEFANTNIELWTLNFNKIFYNEAYNYLENVNPSIIYQRYSLNNYSGIKLAQNFKVPFVLEYNGSEVWICKNWGTPLEYESLSEKIELLNLNFADLIVVVSQPMKDELLQRGINSEKILVNPNGVNPDKYSPDIDGSSVIEKYNLRDKTVLGFIGTFGMWHGAEVLADAFGLLLKKYPEYKDNVKLLMIGDGIRMLQVKENITKHNIENHCILTGLIPQNEGPSHLAVCDILVSPHVPNPDGTKFFGSPTKLFEYMSMGKGIVASKLDQIGEILEHNNTAWMVTPGNIDELVEGLKTLIDDKNLRLKLGKAAREKVLINHTWKKHTENIINALKGLLKND